MFLGGGLSWGVELKCCDSLQMEVVVNVTVYLHSTDFDTNTAKCNAYFFTFFLNDSSFDVTTI